MNESPVSSEVEQRPRKAKVGGSTPSPGTSMIARLLARILCWHLGCDWGRAKNGEKKCRRCEATTTAKQRTRKPAATPAQ